MSTKTNEQTKVKIRVPAEVPHDTEVAEETMSATVKLATETDEPYDIDLLTAECQSRTPHERRRVTQRCDLRPTQGGAEDTKERVLVLHTEMCEKSESGRRRRHTPTPTGSPTPKSPIEGSALAAPPGRVRVAPLQLDRPIVCVLEVHYDGGVSRYQA